MKLRNAALALLIMAAIAGCGDTPTSTPVGNPSPTPATSQNTPAANPTKAQVTTPAFTFMPRRGAAGTQVNLIGANFKPSSKVAIRIGNPQPVGEALASADVGADGRWSAAVTIPGTLPSGQALESKSPGDIQIVAMDESNNVIVSQPFDLVGTDDSGNTQSNDPAQAATAFLTALQSDPTGKSGERFLSSKFRAQLASGTPVVALLNLQGVPTGFTVGQAVAGTAPNTSIVPVTITSATGNTDLMFNFVRQLNTWAIDSVTAK